jgi:PPP family 3-phenylpropionic acid transporter
MTVETTQPTGLKPIAGRARLSGIYFVTFFAFSAILPYMALYFSSVGFSGSQIGALLGLGPLLSLVATPFWTGVADSTKRHHLVLVSGIIALLAGYALVPLLQSFTEVLVVIVFIALLSSQVISLQDSATMHMLGERRDMYGRIRLWGTIGWGIGAPLFGAVFDQFGLVWMFWIYSVMMAFNLLLVNGLQFDRTGQSVSVISGLRALAGDARWRLILLISFLAAIGLSAHNSYVSLLVSDLGEVGQTIFGMLIPASTIVGIVLFVSTMCELPVMFFSTSLLARLGDRGPTRCK